MIVKTDCETDGSSAALIQHVFDCPGPLPPGQTRARPALARVGVHPRGGQQVGVT